MNRPSNHTNGRKALVLASGSPRRKLLLGLLGIPFAVEPSDVDESGISAPSPQEFARRAAEAKCLDVAGKRDALVVGSDTVVHFREASGEEIMLGKPSGPEEAVWMLRQLQGRTHQVTTGVAVSRPGGGPPEIGSKTTNVIFRPLSEEEIKSYVATGESLDKAGSYAVQGQGGDFIEKIDGDLQNVIGLPLKLMADMLKKDYPDLRMPDAETLRKACETHPP